jgi:hypothetical protein
MICPSDPYTNQSLFAGMNTVEGDNWARGNYGANGALGFMTHDFRPAGGRDTELWRNPQTRGVMGVNVALNVAKITDGTSKTLLVGEIRAGLTTNDRRGVWALGGAAASSLWGHGTDDAIGPNPCIGTSDNILGCNKVIQELGEPRLVAECMTCISFGNEQGATRSLHIDGINVCMADGSGRFISDFIDKGTQWEPDPAEYHTWQRLNASGDAQVIGDATY